MQIICLRSEWKLGDYRAQFLNYMLFYKLQFLIEYQATKNGYCVYAQNSRKWRMMNEYDEIIILNRSNQFMDKLDQENN